MRGITKQFSGTYALKGVSFRLAAGTVHCLVGKNGAGKSTLIKILGGAHRSTEGEICIDGREVEFADPAAARAAGIAIVHQELSLVPGLTVAENMFLGRWSVHGRGRIRWGALHRAAQELLDRLGVSVDLRRTAGELSVAQQQMVEIAKALAQDARILVLDEPTSALSDTDAHRLLGIVRGLARRGIGVVYISHRLGEIEELADVVTVLRDGRAVGTRARGDFDRDAIVHMMVGEHIPLSRIRTEQLGSVVLRVRGLTRRPAFAGIDFDLHRGEILGIAGLVGAGRTELVRALFGADRFQSGTIELFGEAMAHPTPNRMRRNGVAFLPEDRKHQALILGLSVRENTVLTVLRQLTSGPFMSRRRETALVARLMRELHVVAAGQEMPVRSLSGGNQQKVVMAKWLAISPRILILDEPTRGIDVQAKAQIFTILQDLAARGLAIIFISSELEEVLAVSTRILTVARGRAVSLLEAADTDMRNIVLAAAS